MKKIICLFITAVLCSATISFVGCAPSEPVIESNKIVFADFENWAPNFQTMGVYEEFGRVTQNNDKQFVKSGDFSAKLQPVGGRISDTLPTVLLPLSSKKFNFDYSDFTNFSEVSAQLYNDSDKPIKMTFGLASSFKTLGVSKMVGDEIILQPKVWTRASYFVDCEFLSIIGTATEVAGLYLQFPDSGVTYPDDAPSIYLDDIIITKADEKQKVTGTMELDKTYIDGDESLGIETSEICSFEKIYQNYMIKSNVTDSLGSVSVVKAEKFNVPAHPTRPSDNVLRVLRHNVRGATFSVSVPSKLIVASGLSAIPEDKWAEYYFCFDMYSATNFTQYHSINWQKVGGTAFHTPNWWIYNKTADTYGWKTLNQNGVVIESGYYNWPCPKNNQWTQFKISLWELADGCATDASKNYIKNPADFSIVMATDTKNIGVDCEIFLDNFRLVHDTKLAGVK